MSKVSRACACVLGLAALVAFSATATAAVDGPIGFWVGNDYQFTISNNDLATMGVLTTDPHPDGFLTQSPYNRPSENNVQFNFKFEDVTGWRDFQVGWAMKSGPGTLPGEYWNLSAYDSLMLSFHNETVVPENGDPEDYALSVNLFMNTGWTDPPEDWTNDMYAQNTWTWILPSESVVLDLDFNNAERWQAGNYLGWGPIGNLGQVTALGFNIGSNAPGSGDYSFPAGVEGQICVDTIPEPSSMIVWGLLGVLGFGLAWWRARR